MIIGPPTVFFISDNLAPCESISGPSYFGQTCGQVSRWKIFLHEKFPGIFPAPGKNHEFAKKKASNISDTQFIDLMMN
ncbi:MAG: hypothetical protein DMG61_13595 [Acidobacteria bacterium]|nr:MAG: hypothetical protein DMG61_13595 [Acidobacteriota bacterium]